MRWYSLLSVAACAVLGSPAILPAQERWPITVELSGGVTRGFSDHSTAYLGSNESGILANVLIGLRVPDEGARW